MGWIEMDGTDEKRRVNPFGDGGVCVCLNTSFGGGKARGR